MNGGTAAAASPFRLLIREVAESLGLGDIPFVPHSFRHGGATYLFQRNTPIQNIMFRGRWAALESARRYVQTARALLMMLDIPEHLNTAGNRYPLRTSCRRTPVSPDV